MYNINKSIKDGEVQMQYTKIPYGISDFGSLREEDYLYIDKTNYIEILEKYAPYQFFIRPRRFGKSLFISMLEHYYDKSKKDKFEDLFKDLYIYNHLTKKHSSYLVLKLSFAGINVSQGKEALIKDFDYEVKSKVSEFIEKYQSELKVNSLPEDADTAVTSLKYIISRAALAGEKIFVLIDEYDNFANDLMNRGRDLYIELLSGEGYIKTFYKTLKDGTTNSIGRIFITGVSPIMLDDLTSGFNITENLTLVRSLNGMLGFTEDEVRYIMENAGIKGIKPISEIIDDMRSYYNGYMFSDEASEKIYNSDMSLYFLKHLFTENNYPKNMIDDNVKTDYGRINQLVLNFEDENILKDIITKGEISTQLVQRFNLADMYNVKENFISLLFYLGMLTIKGTDEYGTKLCIPNYVIQTLYWEYFYRKMQKEVRIDNSEIQKAVREMRIDGKIESFITYFSSIMETLSNRDLISFDEKYIKSMLMTFFTLDGMYMANSELENEKGYVDIFLSKTVQYEKYINYEWLIELKYLKESDRSKLDTVKKEGLSQLKYYAESRKVSLRPGSEKIKKVLLIFIGKKDVCLEEITT